MKRLAVIGHPVAHSRSPRMHSAALGELGLADQWSYEAIDVAPEDLRDVLARMPSRRFHGLNVTIPHKEAVLELATRVAPRAEAIGAANTLTFAAGEVEADNTDAPGFLAAIGGDVEGSRALVLGAGGTARAVVWALAREGCAIEVWNRTPERARRLSAELGGRPLEAEGAGADEQESYDLIVNCTAAGLGGGDPFGALPLERSRFREGQIVADMVYGDRPSAILDAAGRGGARTVDGTEMLVRQGAISFELWTGYAPPLDVMRSAAREA